MVLPQKLDFLASVRFWCLVVVAILGVLQQQGILSSEVTTAIDTVLWAIVGVRTANQVAGAISDK
jgi:hypothetical protein